MLEIERDFFDERREEWLAFLRHRYVLVKERTLVGDFDTQEDALVEGARRFGLQSFLVRRVEDHEEVVALPALTL